MILSFDNFILEKYLNTYYSPLYHYTSIQGLLMIFLSGEIRKSQKYNTVSFTRSNNFFNILRPLSGNSNQVKLEFDTEKLKKNFKITPYNYYKNDYITHTSYDEDEEISLINIPIKYVSEITIYEKNCFDNFMNIFHNKDVKYIFKENKLNYYLEIGEALASEQWFIDLSTVKEHLIYLANKWEIKIKFIE